MSEISFPAKGKATRTTLSLPCDFLLGKEAQAGAPCLPPLPRPQASCGFNFQPQPRNSPLLDLHSFSLILQTHKMGRKKKKQTSLSG